MVFTILLWCQHYCPVVQRILQLVSCWQLRLEQFVKFRTGIKPFCCMRLLLRHSQRSMDKKLKFFGRITSKFLERKGPETISIDMKSKYSNIPFLSWYVLTGIPTVMVMYVLSVDGITPCTQPGSNLCLYRHT